MNVVVVTGLGHGTFARTVPEFVVARDMLRRGHDVHFIVPAQGEFSAVLRELGIGVTVRRYATRARTLWMRAARAFGTSALAERHAGADCIVGFRLSSTDLALGLGRRLGVPVMAFLHGHTARREKYLHHGCHRADLVAAVSRAALDAYDCATVGHRSHDQRLELIRNGIDDEAFRASASRLDARAAAGIPAGVPLVGIAGADRRKGVDVFVRAAARLAGLHPDAHYVVCGRFPSEELRREVLGIAERAGLAGRLHAIGFQENVGAFMRASDVWTMPSRNDAFPLVGLEVAAVGRPIVASAVGGIPEMVVDGQTGFLVPSGDDEALARQLAALLGDGALRERMGKCALRFVREELSLQKQVDRFEECLQRLKPSREVSWART